MIHYLNLIIILSLWLLLQHYHWGIFRILSTALCYTIKSKQGQAVYSSWWPNLTKDCK